MKADPQRFRVTWLCKCAADYAEGYGATLDEARTNVEKFFRKEHGKAKPREIVEEEVVTTRGGAQHYAEIKGA